MESGWGKSLVAGCGVVGHDGGVGGARRVGCWVVYWVGNGKPGDSAQGNIPIREMRCVETNNPAQVGSWTDQTPGGETI